MRATPRQRALQHARQPELQRGRQPELQHGHRAEHQRGNHLLYVSRTQLPAQTASQAGCRNLHGSRRTIPDPAQTALRGTVAVELPEAVVALVAVAPEGEAAEGVNRSVHQKVLNSPNHR